jgi:hypothetical protein
MKTKCLLIGLFALVAAGSASARPVQLMPGVSYERKLEWTASGPRVLYVVTAPRPTGLYSLAPLLSNGTITGRETVSSMERRVSAQMTTVGVNGDFFSWSGGWPSGLLMQGGVLEHHPAHNRSSLGIDTSGTLHVDRQPFAAGWRGISGLNHAINGLNEPPKENNVSLFTAAWGSTTPKLKATAVVLEPFPASVPFVDLPGTVTRIVTDTPVAVPKDGAVLLGRGSAGRDLLADAAVGASLTVRLGVAREWSTVRDAVGGGPALVRDGKPIAKSGEALSADQLYGREPRTAIGQRPDGGLILIVADGRRRGWSVGISNWDLALVLMRYGAVTGFALDSGGSSTLAFDGRVLNRPSDSYGERAVGEALVLGYVGVYAPAPAATLSPNGDGRADRETLSYKVVRASTVSVKLIAPDGTARELDAGPKPAGTYRVVWNGTDAAGAPAVEGRYRWSVTATDDLGRTSTAVRPFTLDDTLGFVSVGRNARTVAFTLARDASVRVTVEDRFGEILRTVASGRRLAGRSTVAWNGRDGRRKLVPRGSYVVHVAATSELGLSELRMPLSIRR